MSRCAWRSHVIGCLRLTGIDRATSRRAGPAPEPLVAQAAAVAIENLTGSAEPSMRQPRGLKGDNSPVSGSNGLPTRAGTIEAELIQRLQSPDRDIVRRAAVALGHTGGDPARIALRQQPA
ncbi:MAG: hypothetical protein R3C56_36050 [Pirellulaceae bacterium]